MNIQELLNRTDRFAANAGCRITEVDEQHAVAERGQLTFGISNSIMFVSSAKEGDMLRAEAVNVADHPKIPSVEVRVTNQEGRLICHVTGMGYRKAVSVPQ